MTRLALIHATPVAVEPIRMALDRLWSEVEVMNLLDDMLGADRGRVDRLDAPLAERIGALADYALAAGAHGILYTCSAFGPAIEGVAARLSIPVLRPNEAMYGKAMELGTRIGMVATFAPAVAEMEEEFVTEAARAKCTASLVSVVADGAMDALRAGDVDAHNSLVADAAREIADAVDAIMLAHFSTARALEAVRTRVSRPVLTSPDSSVLKMKARMEAQRAQQV